jgi:LysM repeat protein
MSTYRIRSGDTLSAIAARFKTSVSELARTNKLANLKQVNMTLEQALKTPGLVLTWEKTSSRLGSIYGHTAITTGDGRSSVSDFIERNTLGAGGRGGFKVFMPTM